MGGEGTTFERVSLYPDSEASALQAIPVSNSTFSVEIECIAECVAKDSLCTGVNFSEQEHKCELLDKTTFHSKLEARMGYVYYQVKVNILKLLLLTTYAVIIRFLFADLVVLLF